MTKFNDCGAIVIYNPFVDYVPYDSMFIQLPIFYLASTFTDPKKLTIISNVSSNTFGLKCNVKF